MAGSVNKVILVGNLGRDPEIRSTQDGMRIANLNLATSESWRDKDSGERKEKTEWHRVVIFNENLAKIAEQYLKKGAKVYVEGQLQTRKWTDQSGVEKYSTEVVLQGFNATLTMLDGRDNSSGARGSDTGGDFGESAAHRSGRHVPGGKRQTAQMSQDIRHAKREAECCKRRGVVAAVAHEGVAHACARRVFSELLHQKPDGAGSFVRRVEAQVQVHA